MDITGKKYNHLTAINMTRKEGKKEYWLFQCDCGNQLEVLKRYVMYNDVTRCRTCAGRIGDIAGKKWGKLTALKLVHGNIWEFICDCGEHYVGQASQVMRGKTIQCHKCKIERLKTLGVKHGKTNARLHRIWSMMKSRCYNKNFWAYKWYGEKGVIICDEWLNNFNCFYDWALKNGYQENLTIDRIDYNGNYCPENCRWITQNEQMKNMSNRVYITYKGETLMLIEWARKLNINPYTLYKRYERVHKEPQDLFTPYLDRFN